MGLTVLVARGGPEADDIVSALRAKGFDAFAEAPIRFEPLDAQPPRLDGVGALAITSANGARAAGALWPDPPRLTTWCVGDATAAAAKAEGFSDLRSAGGDSIMLAAAIAADPPPGDILHLTGEATAGDLPGALAAAGIAYRKTVVYRMASIAALSDRARAALASPACATLLFSPKGAEALGRLTAFPKGVALCLSEAVATAARAAGWADARSAERPDRAALFALLDRVSQAAPMG